MLMTPRYMTLVNGSFEHAISANDRGLAYGDGVFRTMRVLDGMPVSWPFHYQKLVADCAAIGIVCPSAEILMADLQRLFEEELLTESGCLVAKIIITRGEGERGYAPPVITVPTRVLIKSPYPKYPDSLYQQGAKLRICDMRLGKQVKLAGVKHLNRLENVIARMEWRDESIFDGLLLDEDNNVIEATMSNIFVRVGKSLFTPDLRACGVAGITRQRILGLSRVLDFSIEIQPISLQRLMEADEVILCNSLYGAFQVHQIADKIWPTQMLAEKIRNIVLHD